MFISKIAQIKINASIDVSLDKTNLATLIVKLHLNKMTGQVLHLPAPTTSEFTQCSLGNRVAGLLSTKISEEDARRIDEMNDSNNIIKVAKR